MQTITLLAASLLCLLSSTLHAADPAVAAPAKRPVKVFILAGQSNMEGKAKVALAEYQAAQSATRDLYQYLRKDDKWIVREDVWVKFLDRKGKLTVGFGSPGCIGPELGFGNVVGDCYEEPVLLIKTAWGGRSLYRDFRSPSPIFRNLIYPQKWHCALCADSSCYRHDDHLVRKPIGVRGLSLRRAGHALATA